nr:hypothetical protein [Euryarchaeota archaeon]
MRAKLLTLTLMLALMPFSATAQDDPPDIPAGWEIGIDTPQDTEPIFEIGLDGEVSVKFWIDNQNMVAMSLDIEYDIPFDGSANGPETVEVSAQTNKTFDFIINQIDVAAFAASQSDRFIVTGTVTGYAGLPTTGGDSKDGEGNVTIPMVVDLTIDLSESSGPLNAGTTSSLEVIVSNEGNAVDSVYKVTVTDSCPLLDVGGAEELEGIAIEMGENLTQILNITTSDSHPTKNCVIEISIQSRGDIDAGRSQTADSDESTVSIVEDRGDTSDGGEPSDNDDGSSNDGDVVSQNWTPIWPGSVIITLLLGALIRRRN